MNKYRIQRHIFYKNKTITLVPGFAVSQVNSLSVIIPAYNEKDLLHKAIEQIVAELERRRILFEIVVINDGSNDGTYLLLENISAADPRIVAVQHPKNRGKGRALATGIANSSHKWILLVDADLQISMSEFTLFEAAASEAKVIIGNRTNKGYTPYRKLISWVFGTTVEFFFNLKVRDANCPFKLFRKDLLKVEQLRTSGFGIDVEILWHVSKAGARIKEIPVESTPRRAGQSKVTPLKLAQCVCELITLRLK